MATTTKKTAAVGEVLEQVVREAREALGENLVGLILYGSHARGEAVPGSDINLFFSVRDSSAEALAPLVPRMADWRLRGVTSPVIFELGQLQRSRDTFALELTEIAAAHRLLWGEDPLAGFVPDWAAVRNELEHESRQKTIYLKRRWLAAGDQEAALRALLRETVPGYLALLRGMLLYRRQRLELVSGDTLLAELCTYCSWIRPELWEKLRVASKAADKLPKAELGPLVMDYIEQARAFVRDVDQLADRNP